MFPSSFPAPPGLSPKSLTLISTVFANTSATVDIEIPIDPTYSDYLLLVSELLPATDGQVLKVALRQSNVYSGTVGVAYTDTNGGATSIGNAQTAGGVAICTAGLRNTVGSGTLCGEFFIKSPSGTVAPKFVNYKTCHGLGASNPAVVQGAIESNPVTPVTGIRFLMAAGNIVSGAFRLYGITRF